MTADPNACQPAIVRYSKETLLALLDSPQRARAQSDLSHFLMKNCADLHLDSSMDEAGEGEEDDDSVEYTEYHRDESVMTTVSSDEGDTESATTETASETATPTAAVDAGVAAMAAIKPMLLPPGIVQPAEVVAKVTCENALAATFGAEKEALKEVPEPAKEAPAVVNATDNQLAVEEKPAGTCGDNNRCASLTAEDVAAAAAAAGAAAPAVDVVPLIDTDESDAAGAMPESVKAATAAGAADAASAAAVGSEASAENKEDAKKEAHPKIDIQLTTFETQWKRADFDVRDQVSLQSNGFFNEECIDVVGKKGWRLDVAMIPGRVVIGWILYGKRPELNFVEVKKLFVVPDMRKHGIGRKLVRLAMIWTKKEKYPLIGLWSYSHAEPFYQRMGFSFAEEHRLPEEDGLAAQSYMELDMKVCFGGGGGGGGGASPGAKGGNKGGNKGGKGRGGRR